MHDIGTLNEAVTYLMVILIETLNIVQPFDFQFLCLSTQMSNYRSNNSRRSSTHHQLPPAKRQKIMSSTDNQRCSINSVTTFSTVDSSERNNSCDSSTPGVRLGEAARMQQLAKQQSSGSLQGSEGHRPLVGGFAAAAYEAMKELHFSTAEEERKSL